MVKKTKSEETNERKNYAMSIYRRTIEVAKNLKKQSKFKCKEEMILREAL